MIEIPDWADTIGDADLIAFVKARLAEDEAAAGERRGVFPSPGVEDGGAVWLHIKRGGNAVVVHYGEPVAGYGDMADLRRWADAEQGWTAERAMREVEAKHRHLDQYRMAVAACQLAPAGEARGLESYRAAAWGAVLSDAAVWCEHPEYQAKWKP